MEPDIMAIQVVVIYSPTARVVHEVALNLANGATVAQALHLSGIPKQFPDLELSQAFVGVWGRQAGPNQLLRNLDRIEIYRGLKVDPKAARRERFVKQGARTTGLFAKKRQGAKAGY